MTAVAKLPQPKYLARLSKDGEWLELLPADDWTAEMWAHGTEPVYSAEQMRAALSPAELGGVECTQLRPGAICLTPQSCKQNGCDVVERESYSPTTGETHKFLMVASTPRAAEAVTEEVFAIVRPYLQPEAREKVRAALTAALTPPSAKGE